MRGSNSVVGMHAPMVSAIVIAAILIAALGTVAYAKTPTPSDRLRGGEYLYPGDHLRSENGKYELVLQHDGNLVLYRKGSIAVWATKTAGKKTEFAVMQHDGNFVLYEPDGPIWATGTDGNPGSWLTLQDDRTLVLYDHSGRVKWSSPTRCDLPPSVVDDYLKAHFDMSLNEIGFRVGSPIIAHEVSKTPVQRISDTRYNKRYVHGVELDGIADDGLRLRASLRWERFEHNPLTGGVWKIGEINCDGTFLLKAYVTAEHGIGYTNPPLSLGTKCSSSRIGLPEAIDQMCKGVTWIYSGGETSFGFFDIMAGFGMLAYDFSALFAQTSVTVSDPIELRVLSGPLTEFVDRVIELDYAEQEVYLKDIRYDPKGVWFVFSYPEHLEDAAQQIANLVYDL